MSDALSHTHTHPHNPSDRIGVLFGGFGAISTTLVAGVEAIKKGLAKPIGSLAMLGTINAGTDAEPRLARIPDYITLPPIESLVFGAWDVMETDGYRAAQRAGVLDFDLLESLAHDLAAIKPWPGVFDPRFNRRVEGSFFKTGKDFMHLATLIQDDILRFQDTQHLDRCVLLWCGSTEAYLAPMEAHQSLGAFEAALRASDHKAISPSMIYAYAALSLGIPCVNATPSRMLDIPALVELAAATGAPVSGKDLKTGQTLVKTILAPGIRDRVLGLHGWYSTNILGNRDGETLDDADAFKTKQETKLSALSSILRSDLYPDLYGQMHHQVRINYYPPRGDNKESWDAVDIFGWLGYPMSIKIDFLCRDSILAAPLLLDLALFMDLAKRSGMSGPQEWLSFYFKSPMCESTHLPEHELSVQLENLRRELHRLKGAGATAPLAPRVR